MLTEATSNTTAPVSGVDIPEDLTPEHGKQLARPGSTRLESKTMQVGATLAPLMRDTGNDAHTPVGQQRRPSIRVSRLPSRTRSNDVRSPSPLDSRSPSPFDIRSRSPLIAPSPRRPADPAIVRQLDSRAHSPIIDRSISPAIDKPVNPPLGASAFTVHNTRAEDSIERKGSLPSQANKVDDAHVEGHEADEISETHIKDHDSMPPAYSPPPQPGRYAAPPGPPPHMQQLESPPPYSPADVAPPPYLSPERYQLLQDVERMTKGMGMLGKFMVNVVGSILQFAQHCSDMLYQLTRH